MTSRCLTTAPSAHCANWSGTVAEVSLGDCPLGQVLLTIPVLLRTLGLDDLGGTPVFMEFAEPDRFDMLVGGESLRALTADGEPLWEVPHEVRQMIFSADGEKLWEHDLATEMATINGTGHYASVALGAFADDPEVDPVAFLFGGSAGIYVVDGKTTRAS